MLVPTTNTSTVLPRLSTHWPQVVTIWDRVNAKTLLSSQDSVLLTITDYIDTLQHRAHDYV